MTIPGFPNTSTSNWRPTSRPTFEYNCLAHAIHNDKLWIWPDAKEQFAWPQGMERDESLAGVLVFLASLGYVDSADGTLEVGWRKIAIYQNDDGVQHFARQESDGHWSSKMGPMLDLEHASASVLEGGTYGKVVAFVKRQWTGPPPLPPMYPPPAKLISTSGMPLVK